jgi:hypothetical protein
MLKQLTATAGIGFRPRHAQPKISRVVLATLAAIAGSLAADALLVVIGQAIFPGTRGYVHFQFHDYARLTVIGVIIACAAWPVVTRISSDPRWLFLRLAILVTLVLWMPDVYILYRGQPGDAVAVLFVMHLAIALVTYNLLVRLAPTGPAPRQARSSDLPSRVISPGMARPDTPAEPPLVPAASDRGRTARRQRRLV